MADNVLLYDFQMWTTDIDSHMNWSPNWDKVEGRMLQINKI